MIKAIVFDIDNTLTYEVSWLKITELLGGSVKEHEKIFEDFLRNKVPYEDAKRRLIKLWQQTGNANKPFWINMLKNWSINKDAVSLVSYMQKQKYNIVLITGSLDLFALAISQKLNIPSWYANTTLVWDDDGELIDFHYVRDQAAQKLTNLQDFVTKNNIEMQDCIVVGDGNNDIAIFKVTKRGIAVNSQSKELLKVAWKRASNLKEVKNLIIEEEKKEFR